MTTLVIVCGSSIRGDDGVGGRVADVLERTGQGGIEFLRVHQLTPELADDVAKAERTIIVDAGVGKRVSLRRVAARAGTALTHHLTAQTLVGLVERLYKIKSNVYLLAVPGSSFSLSEELSISAERAAQRAARRFVRFLNPDSPVGREDRPVAELPAPGAAEPLMRDEKSGLFLRTKKCRS
jgi:hydrogenase maturation protease